MHIGNNQPKCDKLWAAMNRNSDKQREHHNASLHYEQILRHEYLSSWLAFVRVILSKTYAVKYSMVLPGYRIPMKPSLDIARLNGPPLSVVQTVEIVWEHRYPHWLWLRICSSRGNEPGRRKPTHCQCVCNRILCVLCSAKLSAGRNYFIRIRIFSVRAVSWTEIN